MHQELMSKCHFSLLDVEHDENGGAGDFANSSDRL
jgi:hypothetical protein